MRNKEINKKAKAPLMRRSAQLDYNKVDKPAGVSGQHVPDIQEDIETESDR